MWKEEWVEIDGENFYNLEDWFFTRCALHVHQKVESYQEHINLMKWSGKVL